MCNHNRASGKFQKIWPRWGALGHLHECWTAADHLELMSENVIITVYKVNRRVRLEAALRRMITAWHQSTARVIWMHRIRLLSYCAFTPDATCANKSHYSRVVGRLNILSLLASFAREICFIRAWNSLHNRREFASWEGLLPGSSSLVAIWLTWILFRG